MTAGHPAAVNVKDPTKRQIMTSTLNNLADTSRLLVFGLLIGMIPATVASIRGPYVPDEHTFVLLHLDEPASSGIAANAVAGGPSFVASANPSAATPRQPAPGILGAPGASGFGYDFGTCANLSFSNSMALYIDANGNGVADLDTAGGSPGADEVSGSSFTGPNGEFTLEALVNLPSLTGANREIISMDNSRGASERPFQFRITATGQLEFNNIAVSGANPKTTIPTTGPDAFVPNQWFHVAMTYDGAGTIVFYWTKLDGARTAPTVLAVHSVPALNLTGSAVLTIGNENRNTSGEGLLGMIDEVRISSIARTETDMIFDPSAPPIPPAIDPQPEDQFLGVGETLTIVAHASGSPVLTYRWQKGSGDVFTDIPGETSDTLSLPVTFATEGYYRFIVQNAYGQATSRVAHVTVGAVFSSLYPTGFDDAKTLLEGGTVDPHYVLWTSCDQTRLGPDMYVTTDILDYTANDEKSKWISPAPTLGGVRGVYTYRTTFLIDSAKVEGSTLSASVLSGGSLKVYLNDQPTGIENLTPGFPGPHRNLFSFVLTNGFVQGVNTLDFVVDNATTVPNAPGGNAIRVVSIRGVGPALAPGLSIVTHPKSQTVREGGRVTFACVATGRPPLRYQWYGDDLPIAGATSRTLDYPVVYAGAQPTHFKVVVQNDESTVTSETAVLTITPNNQPVVAQDISLAGFAGAPLSLPLSTLVHMANDPDGDPIQFVASDSIGTNTVSPGQIELVDAVLVYSNAPGFTGTDLFYVTLTDGWGLDTTVPVSVRIEVAPRLSISMEPSGLVRLAWPAAATDQGFRLLSADGLGAQFSQQASTPRRENDQSVLRLAPAQGTQKYYRLAYP